MPGFTVNADTRALYKYNEASVTGTGYATAVDACALGGTARNLAESGMAGGGLSRNYTHIINGPNLQGRARWFPGSGLNAHLERVGDATISAALLGSWSWEAWVCPNQQSQNVWSYCGAVSATAAENYLGQVYFDTTGFINMFWETGGGSAVSSASAAGAISWGVWQHVAITMDWSGATVTVRFYVNNTLVSTVTGKTKATGGANADFYVGKDPGGNANYWGAIKDIRLSNKVRDATEIAASVATSATDYQHAIDGNTLWLLRLNEEPDAIEETDYGYHLRKVSGTITVVDPLVTDSGHARAMDASTEYDGHWGYEPFRLMLEGDWTYQCWVQFDSGYAGVQRGQWVYGDPGVESLATNFVSLDLNGTRVLQLYQEYAGGTDVISAMTTPIFPTLADGLNKHLLTVTKRNTGGTACELKFYRDTTLVETLTPAQIFAGGTSSWLRVSSGASGGANAMLGRVDDQRWMVGVVTLSDIEDLFEETSSGGVPEIALVSPAEGAIDTTDSIVIDVTDVDDDIFSVIIYVQNVNLGTVELVVHGTIGAATIFAPFSSSVRTPITDGYRYTITRTGGWIDTDITVHVLATDTLGNSDEDEFDFAPDYVVIPPVITLDSPAEGPIATTDDLVVHVTDADDGLFFVVMWIELVTSGIIELVLHGTIVSPTFFDPYGTSGRTVIADGYEYTIHRDAGWVDSAIRLHVFAQDLSGHTTTEVFEFEPDFDGVYACGLEGVRPVVTIESPLPVDTPASPISATDPLVFTITDADAEPGVGGGLQRVVPMLVFPEALRSLGAQMIHDGDAFAPMFTGSTREAITGGYRYTVVWWNEGRWPSRPRLLPFAYDLRGNEAL